jgi:methionyl-tRNA synthetase
VVTDTRARVAEKMKTLHVADAITEIFTLFKRCNKYIDETMPWALAKDEAKKDRLSEVLYNLCESITIGANLLTPYMPKTAERILAQLYPDNPSAGVRDFDDLDKIGLRESGLKVTENPEILFARLDLDEVLKDVEELQAKQKQASGDVEYPQVEEKPEISFEDFEKVQIRVGEVLKCEPVKKAKKLLCSQIRIGSEVRQIVSGISKYYKPEEMVGKKVAVVTNLAPRTICGVESQGMILAAMDDKDNLAVMTVDRDIIAGSEIG